MTKARLAPAPPVDQLPDKKLPNPPLTRPATQPAVWQPSRQLPWLREVICGPDGLQAALRSVIESMPRRPANSHDLAKIVKMHSGSVWRLWEAAYASTPEESSLAVSGEVAFVRLLDKLVLYGANRAAADRSLTAFKQFIQVVEENAGGIDQLKMIIERNGENALTPQDKYSKSLFDAASYREGIQSDVVFKLFVRGLSDLEGVIDLIDFGLEERISTLRSAEFHRIRATDAADCYRDTETEQPLQPVEHLSEDLGAPPHCPLPEGVQPAPIIRELSNLNGRSIWKRSRPGFYEEKCVSDGIVGAKGAFDVAAGTRRRYVEAEFPHSKFFGAGTKLLVPTKLFILDIYVDEREVSAGCTDPLPVLYDQRWVRRPGELVQSGPSFGLLEHYRPGVQREPLAEVRQYSQVVQIIETLAHRPLNTMHLFRWRVPYPLTWMLYGLAFGNKYN